MAKLFSTQLPHFIRELPETPEPATWECPTCGPIAPYPVKWGGTEVIRYRKQQCPCQKEAERKRKEDEERREWIAAAYPMAYNWLTFRQDPIPFRANTFASFDASRQPEAYEIARLWASNPQGTLILYGTFGSGKTHLLTAIINEGIEVHKRYSLFTTTTKLFNAIQERMHCDDGYASLLRRASTTPLLVLDDIDKVKLTDFKQEIYFTIIDERVIHGLPTAISTNKLDDLASYVGGAVADRLNIGQIAVPMMGESYRKQL
jgi:DNA replication protein DnaC